MSLPDHDPFPNHRPNIGVVLFNGDGQVWLGRRTSGRTRPTLLRKPIHETGPDNWQFPQGGLDRGETPEACSLRELYEETGISKSKVSFLARTPDWLAYDFPPEVRALKKASQWVGQKQLWFAYRFLGEDRDFNLNIEWHPEFDDFRWTSMAEAVDRIIEWKRPVYQHVANQFKDFGSVK